MVQYPCSDVTELICAVGGGTIDDFCDFDSSSDAGAVLSIQACDEDRRDSAKVSPPLPVYAS